MIKSLTNTFVILALVLCAATTSFAAASDNTAALQDYINNSEHRNLVAGGGPDCDMFDKYIRTKTTEMIEEDGPDAIKSFVCNKVFGNEYLSKMIQNPFKFFQGDEYGVCRASKFLNAIQEDDIPLLANDGTLDLGKCDVMMSGHSANGRRKLPIRIPIIKTEDFVKGATVACMIFCK